MVRTRRGERTVAEVLDAAREHLLEAGLDGFSLREVARRAGLTPSALYNHFESREALVNQLAMEAVRMLGTYLESVPNSMPARERLSALAREYLRFAVEQPERYRLAFDTLVSPSTRWNEFAAVAYPFTLIAEAVADGIAAGEVVDRHRVGASGIAYGLWSLVHGFVMLSAHHLRAIADDLSPLRLAAVESHLDGIFGKEAS